MKPFHNQTITRDAHPQLVTGRVSDTRPEPPLIGERLWDRLDLLFHRLTHQVALAVPDTFNPFTQLGAVANTLFLIAVITGILLLFWYKPSVHQAYDSLEMMRQSPYLAELIRSLHRYSSDACLLFVTLHAFQMLGARKVGGVRWLAWVSGVVTLGLLWVDGWTGYWLVWDERAQLIAKGTAKWLDVLPVFPDPLSRSFLVDGSVNTLFFFIVFFIHMLIPLAMGVGLWIHIMRLNESHFFTRHRMTGVIIVALVLISLIYPATSAQRAAMQTIPQDLTFDWFFLLPVALTDRLEGGMLWLLTLIGTICVLTAPWWITRRRPMPLTVNEDRCHGCTQCFQDCPFNAVTMIPREGPDSVVSYIDPAKCVGCGVCAGSCDPWAIEFPGLTQRDTRKWLRERIKEDKAVGRSPRYIAFICAESAGSALTLDKNGECADLPGYRIVPVPCVSWLFVPMIGQLIRSGAPGVLIVGCGPNPVCRMGNIWMEQRLAGEREPFVESGEISPKQMRYVCLDRTDRAGLFREAADFRTGSKPTQQDTVSNRRLIIAAAIILSLCVVLVGLSDTPYHAPVITQSELVVSFKHPGQLVEKSGDVEAEDPDVLPHMRKPKGANVERYRVPVRVVVYIDENEMLRKTFQPGGLFSDGASIALERISVPTGDHSIRIQLGDSENPAEWQFDDEKTLNFKKAERRVILFDKLTGFNWH